MVSSSMQFLQLENLTLLRDQLLHSSIPSDPPFKSKFFKPSIPTTQSSSWNPHLHSPGGCELNVGIEETRHLATGCLPALDAGTDQSLSLLVPHDFHHTWVTLVYIILQRPFQLFWDTTKYNWATHTDKHKQADTHRSTPTNTFRKTLKRMCTHTHTEKRCICFHGPQHCSAF